jgi:uncharacterized membrane protein
VAAESTPTSLERTLAAASHALTPFTLGLAPLAVYLWQRRRSRFVAFHALQAALHAALWGGAAPILWGCTVLLMGISRQRGGPTHFPEGWLEEVLSSRVPLVLSMLVWTALLLGMPAARAVRSARGEWKAYPAVGPLARRWLQDSTAPRSTGPPPRLP